MKWIVLTIAMLCELAYAGGFPVAQMGEESDLIFKSTGHTNGTWTAPFITASTLTHSQITWYAPDGTTTNDDAPAVAFFLAPGWYRCHVADWSKVTVVSFYAGGNVSTRNFLTSVNLTRIFHRLTAMTSFSLRQQTAITSVGVGGFAWWRFPSTITSLANTFTSCINLTGAIPDWSTMTNNASMASAMLGCTGLTGTIPDWSTMTKNTSMEAALFGCSGLTGSIPNWATMTNNASMNSALFGCSGLTGTIPDWSTMTNNASMASALYGCSGLTGTIPDWSTMTKNVSMSSVIRGCNKLSGPPPDPSAMVLVTTFHDCFALCTNLTGNIGGWTWRTNIVDFDSYNSQLGYTNRPGCFAANVKSGFTMRMDNSKLPSADVDQIIIDLDTSTATGGTCNMGGTTSSISNFPITVAATNALANIRAKGWTVTVNGP